MSASYVKNQLIRHNIQVTTNRDGGRLVGDSDMDHVHSGQPRTISGQHWRGRGGPSRRPFRGRGGMHSDNRPRDALSVTERLGERYGYKGQRQPRGHGGSNNRRWVADSATSDPSRQTWYKVTIPHGKKAGKEFILKGLAEHISAGFTPHQFQFEQDRDAAFFVYTNRTGAEEFSALDRRIVLPSGFKMIVNVKEVNAPPPVREVDDAIVAKMKVAMSNKYNVELKSLDISKFSANEEFLKPEPVFLPVNRLNIMAAVIRIIEENIPELVSLNLSNNRLPTLDGLASLSNKTPHLTSLDLSNNELKGDYELDKIKGWQLTELNVQGNPFASRLQASDSSAALTDAVRKRFPKLIKLNGEVLAPSIRFDVGDSGSLPKTLGSTVTTQPPEIQNLLASFLQEYLLIYDSPKRDPLAAAYHDEAIFSFAVCTNRTISSKSFARQQHPLQDYFQESRNLARVKDDFRRQKLLKQGKFPVLALLVTLPRTSHWLHTFNVDVLHASQSTIVFNVTGLFEEVSAEGQPSSQPMIRAFSRLFVTVPQGSGIVIANEQLSITMATPEQIAEANDKRSQVATSPPDAGPAVPAAVAPDIQQAMVVEFSRQSGMNHHWSTECLACNNWNFEKAAAMFTELKAQGKIPDDAFNPDVS